MIKKVKTTELFEKRADFIGELLDSTEYPWEILPKIKDFINDTIKNGISGYREYSKGVLIGENVKIYPTATIEAPCIIGDNTEIRPGAFVRGNVIIGKNCVIGNSTEVKNSVILDFVQIPHYNYVGDSVLGNHSHMGAGAVCSNLKSDGKNIVIHSDKDYETGLRKIGGILGDNADVGCGSILNPGTVIGKNTSVYPLTQLRGVYPENAIVKSPQNIVLRK